MAEQFTVEWIDRGREPQCPPNPAYPNGKALRLAEDPALLTGAFCTAKLPYPARRCGIYVITCTKCGMCVACTTAGRPDDPISMEMGCAENKGYSAPK